MHSSYLRQMMLAVKMSSTSVKRARQNVILELGYFISKLGLDRVCCISKGEVDLPSDMGGILLLKLTNGLSQIEFEIVKKLNKAGYKVNL
jgi:predicted nucleotide-binding protein